MSGSNEFDLKARRRRSVAVLTGRAGKNGASISSAAAWAAWVVQETTQAKEIMKETTDPEYLGVVQAEQAGQGCCEHLARSISELFARGATFRFALSECR